MSTVRLFGFGPSVYTRVIRIVLAEKGVTYDYEEVNPFEESGRGSPHPFGRVPVLEHGGFALYETAAIARYLDAAFPTPSLTPTSPQAAARMAQVIAVVDAYGYWPMVRQVFAHRVFRPSEGLEPDTQVIAQGVTDAAPVLDALEDIAQEGLVLDGLGVTLADCHLAPMMVGFTAAPEGRAALRQRDALCQWWAGWSRRASVAATDAGFDVPFPPQLEPANTTQETGT